MALRLKESPLGPPPKGCLPGTPRTLESRALGSNYPDKSEVIVDARTTCFSLLDMVASWRAGVMKLKYVSESPSALIDPGLQGLTLEFLIQWPWSRDSVSITSKLPGDADVASQLPQSER